MADIDNVLAKGIGSDILAGSTARYHQAEANKVSSESANALAVAPDVPAAIKGDVDAFARVAAKSPKTADILGQAIQRQNAAQQAHTLAVANYAGNTSAGILAAPPEARGALYDQAKAEAAAHGMDTANWPAQYSEGWVKFQQAKAAGAKAAFEAQEKMRLHTTPGARAAGGGGGEEVIPDGTAVPGRQSALPGPAAPVVAQAAPPDVPGSAPASAGPVVAQAPVAAPTGPAAPPQMAQAGPPPGFQPMGHRDPQGNLVPATINGQAVHRNPQTGEMVLVPATAPAAGPGGPAAPPMVAQAAPAIDPRALATEGALSSGAPGDQPPGTALPDGVQLAQATPKPGAIIYDDPAQMGGKMLGVKQPNGTYKPVEGPGGTVKYRLPDGTTVYYGPHLKNPDSTDKFEDVKGPDGNIIGQRDTRTNQYHPITQIPGSAGTVDPSLKGDEVLAALPPARAAEIKAIRDGDLPIPSAQARSPYAQETRSLVFQSAEPGFTDATHATRMAMKKDMATGKIGNVLTAQGTLFNHLAELQTTAEDLKNTPYPIINKIGNIIGFNSGDPRVTNMATIKHRVNEEAEKYFGGTGAVTVSGLAQAQKELNEAQSPEQLEGSVGKLVKLIAGRQSELTAQINRGLQYPKDRQLTPDDLLTPEAKGSRDKILMGIKEAGAKTAPTSGASGPRLSPEDAAKLPPGTPFIGMDGLPRVRH